MGAFPPIGENVDPIYSALEKMLLRQKAAKLCFKIELDKRLPNVPQLFHKYVVRSNTSKTTLKLVSLLSPPFILRITSPKACLMYLINKKLTVAHRLKQIRPSAAVHMVIFLFFFFSNSEWWLILFSFFFGNLITFIQLVCMGKNGKIKIENMTT